MGPVWMRLPLIAASEGVDEAVARARAHPEGSTSYAAQPIAALLGGSGRTEGAVAVLEQHAHASSHDLAGCLIDLGRIDDAVAALQQPPPGVPRNLASPCRPPPALPALSRATCGGRDGVAGGGRTLASPCTSEARTSWPRAGVRHGPACRSDGVLDVVRSITGRCPAFLVDVWLVAVEGPRCRRARRCRGSASPGRAGWRCPGPGPR